VSTSPARAATKAMVVADQQLGHAEAVAQDRSTNCSAE
jgi:hypothetical protein